MSQASPLEEGTKDSGTKGRRHEGDPFSGDPKGSAVVEVAFLPASSGSAGSTPDPSPALRARNVRYRRFVGTVTDRSLRVRDGIGGDPVP